MSVSLFVEFERLKLKYCTICINSKILFINIYMFLFIESRQRGRFAGFSLYVSNTSNKDSGVLCYKDGPGLPPLDFFTNCLLQGRYVIFYNERLDGTIYPSGYEISNVYTELCEVIVTGKKKCLNVYFNLSLTVPHVTSNFLTQVVQVQRYLGIIALIIVQITV